VGRPAFEGDIAFVEQRHRRRQPDGDESDDADPVDHLTDERVVRAP